MNARDLIVFLVRIMEISLMRTDEITFYLPSTIYTDALKLQSLLVTLPDILPNITFNVMRHEEDQLKRKITKNIGIYFFLLSLLFLFINFFYSK